MNTEFVCRLLFVGKCSKLGIKLCAFSPTTTTTTRLSEYVCGSKRVCMLRASGKHALRVLKRRQCQCYILAYVWICQWVLPITSMSPETMRVWKEGASADTSQLNRPDAFADLRTTTLSFDSERWNWRENNAINRLSGNEVPQIDAMDLLETFKVDYLVALAFANVVTVTKREWMLETFPTIYWCRKFFFSHLTTNSSRQLKRYPSLRWLAKQNKKI